MARVNQESIIQARSSAATAIGTYLDDGALFKKFPGKVKARDFPSRNLVEDDNVGDGNFNPQQGKPYYFEPANIPYSGILNSTVCEEIIRDFMGGVVTPTTNTTPGTIDHAIVQLVPGLAPRARNYIESNGGAAFLRGDVYVQSIGIQQQGSNQPQFTAQMSNGGHYAEIADTAIDVGDILDQDPYKFFDGKRTTLTFVIGATTYNLVNEKRLFDINFSANQNVVVEQLPGDSPIDASNECEGGYTTNCYIGKRSKDSAMMQIKFYAKDTFPEFADWKANNKVTSLILTFSSCEIIGATTHHEEIEIKFPVAEWNITSDVNGDFESYNVDFKAIDGDPTSKSLFLTRIRRVASLT